MRRFYLHNVESILEDTKKGTCPSGQVPFIMLELNLLFNGCLGGG